jgi:putative iron-dependent peroxidase
VSAPQPGILAEVPVFARYLTFRIAPGSAPASVLERVSALSVDDGLVVGLGASLIGHCGGNVPGLRDAPALSGAGVSAPSTPAALWVWLRGSGPSCDSGELLHRERTLRAQLAPVLLPLESIVSGRYGSGRDLTGYEDGTENPTGDDAMQAAIVSAAGAGLSGSSFVAVQKWQHDLDAFFAQSPEECDLTFGRRLSDNEEIETAPASAHVKRTAQEDFDPPAFVVRRSMPWTGEHGAGLVFVAFGHSFDAFERLLHRMLGLDDGVVDSLFRFTRPVSGAFFWCPPLADDRLDLSALATSARSAPARRAGRAA